MMARKKLIGRSEKAQTRAVKPKKSAKTAPQTTVEALQKRLEKQDLILIEVREEYQQAVESFKRQSHCINCLEQKLAAEIKKSAELKENVSALKKTLRLFITEF